MSPWIMSKVLESFGHSLREARSGGDVEHRLYCTHAAKMHPQLDDGAILWPMSQLVLGSLRKRP